jgi:aquaporin Z
MQTHLSARLLAEFIGTFAFVFVGAGAAAVVGTGAGLNGIAAIAFAHGLTIMVFAFAFGNLSGAHFNPAVTVGVLAARAMSLGEAIPYIVSQLVAAACAAFLLRAVLGGVATGLGRPELAQSVVLGATTLTITPAAGFVIEGVLGFFLVIVVLTTAVARSAGNLAPLAIGMTLTLNILMGGALTGAAFNPARALGPMIATADFTNAWLYVIAPIAGALVAALIHKALQLLAEDGIEVAPRAAPAE